jgi:hypothetical protein
MLLPVIFAHYAIISSSPPVVYVDEMQVEQGSAARFSRLGDPGLPTICCMQNWSTRSDPTRGRIHELHSMKLARYPTVLLPPDGTTVSGVQNPPVASNSPAGVGIDKAD